MKDVERLARLLCKSDGWSPDDRATRHMLISGPKGSVLIPEEGHWSIVPLWALYLESAQALLEAKTVTFTEEPA